MLLLKCFSVSTNFTQCRLGYANSIRKPLVYRVKGFPKAAVLTALCRFITYVVATSIQKPIHVSTSGFWKLFCSSSNGLFLQLLFNYLNLSNFSLRLPMIFIITYIIRRTRQNCEQKQQQSTELKRYQVKITLFHETVPLSYNGFFSLLLFQLIYVLIFRQV